MTMIATTPDPARPHLGSAVRSLLGARVGPWDVARGDVVLVLLAFGLGWAAATSDGVKPGGTAAAGAGMILLAAALLLRRAAPVAGLGVILSADLLNVAIFGEHTRCAIVVPITAYLVFSGARRAAGARQIALVVVLVAGLGGATSAFELGPQSIPAMTILWGAVFLVALLVRRRDRLTLALAGKAADLALQRERTAVLAVEAERLRVGDALVAQVEERVDAMRSTVAAAREPELEPQQRAAAFAAIEADGRAGLANMRALLNDLRTPASRTPQPVLAELPLLLAGAGVRAAVEFDAPRAGLSPATEVAACRVVELLLPVIDPHQGGATVQIRQRLSDIEIVISVGDGAPEPDPAAFAAARERAAAVGGRIAIEARRALITLPLGAAA